MKASHQPLSRFIFRTPVLPFSALSAGTADLAALKGVLDDPAIFEAVFVASPELAEAMATWRAGGDLDPALERTLVRYLSRMAGRATPFGLFSGVSVGTIGGPSTSIELAPRSEHHRHTRLDNDYLFSLCNELVRDPAIKPELTFTPNSSLYKVAGRWRYAEARVDGGGRTYHLVAVDATDYLDGVLARAERGATLDQLAEVLLADPEISRDEALAFLDELVTAQLIVPDLQPAVTGPEPAEAMIGLLQARPSAQTAATTLAQANAMIAEIDRAPLGTPPERYRAIASSLGALPPKVNLPRLFQVDLHLTKSHATLGTNVINELSKGVELLRRLTSEGGETQWTRFRDAFSTRYESREVPLVEVLDEEAGIGFGDAGASAQTPLIADLMFPGRPGVPQTPWGTREAYLAGLLANALGRGATEIELVDADLDVIANKTPGAMPDTFAMMAEVIGESSAAIDEGKFRIQIGGVSGASSTRLLGRFCHGSPDVTDVVRELISAEEKRHPDVVFAEVVHLPEGRIGNILLRPVLRSHEIAYLGTSGADREHQIPITDLTVSIDNGRVVLRSKSLGKEVRPQLASAHNYSGRSLVIYRFLCALATQESRGGGWSWGALDSMPFLPRVRHGKIIVARARWLLRRSDLEPLDKAAKGSKTAKTAQQHADIRERELSAVQALRDVRKLPRWIVVADYDNELPVDLDNPLQVSSFVHLVKNRGMVTINELSPAGDELFVRGEGGSYVHEVVVPYVRVDREPIRAAQTPPVREVQRRFPPGSSWLYTKLYGGVTNLEVVLRDVAWPFIQDVRTSGLSDAVFFIRYADPDLHVRIRFRGEPKRLMTELLPEWTERITPAIDAGLVWRMQLDTYEREVERYGGDRGIEICEDWFAADSEAVLAIVDAYRGDDGAVAKWKLAVRGIDRLLDDMGFELARRHTLMTRLRDGFGAEHGMDTELQKRLGDKFRANRGDLDGLIGAADDVPEDHPFAAGIVAFAKRSVTTKRTFAEIHAESEAGRLSVSLDDLASSLIHMHVNRLLAASQRRQELVLYDLLRRAYEGQIARAKRS